MKLAEITDLKSKSQTSSHDPLTPSSANFPTTTTGKLPVKPAAMSRRDFLKRTVLSTLNNALDGLTPMKIVSKITSMSEKLYTWKITKDTVLVTFLSGPNKGAQGEYMLFNFLADRDNDDSKETITALVKKAVSAKESKDIMQMVDVNETTEKTDLFGGETYNGWNTDWEQSIIDDLSDYDKELFGDPDHDNEIWDWSKFEVALKKASPEAKKLICDEMLCNMDTIICKSEVWLELADVPRMSDEEFNMIAKL